MKIRGRKINNMEEKIICTICVFLWQLFNCLIIHFMYKEKIYDIFNAIYQIILFAVFQILIWIIL